MGVGDSHFEADSLAVAEIGRAAGVGALFHALDRINDYIRALDDFHARYDLFLTPTLAKPPLEVGSIATAAPLQAASRVIAKVRAGKLLNATGILEQLISDNLGWVPYTQLANLTGRPAISVPLHWTAAGSAARRPVRRPARLRRPPAPARRPARGGAAVVPAVRRARPGAELS